MHCEPGSKGRGAASGAYKLLDIPSVWTTLAHRSAKGRVLGGEEVRERGGLCWKGGPGSEPRAGKSWAFTGGLWE